MVYRSFDKKAVCFILLFVFLIFPLITPVEANAEFNIVDSYTNFRYQLTHKGDTLYINCDSHTDEFYCSDEIVNVLCRNDVLSLLCVTEVSSDTYLYTIREYNCNYRNLTTIDTNITAASGTRDFYRNNNGIYYIPDSADSKRLYAVSENKTDSITFSSTIYQLLNTDDSDILVFTHKGTYLLNDYTSTHLSDLLPATPCNYSGNGIIIDALNVKYKFSDNTFKELVEQTTDNISNIPQEISVVIEENTITVPYGTTFAKLYKYLGIEKSELKVYKSDKSSVTSGYLGTGMSAEFSGKRFTITIVGDLTGEGNVNSRDLKALMKHLTGKSPLGEPYLTASDIFADGEINTKDLLALSQMY